jgi:hypothetical protein
MSISKQGDVTNRLLAFIVAIETVKFKVRWEMKDTKDLLDFEIYPHLDRAEVVKDLNPKGRNKGSKGTLVLKQLHN